MEQVTVFWTDIDLEQWRDKDTGLIMHPETWRYISDALAKWDAEAPIRRAHRRKSRGLKKGYQHKWSGWKQ